jgi:hypothetical protein
MASRARQPQTPTPPGCGAEGCGDALAPGLALGGGRGSVWRRPPGVTAEQSLQGTLKAHNIPGGAEILLRAPLERKPEPRTT